MREFKEMMPSKPTLGAFFDIDKLTHKYDTASYGFVGWKIIWGAINVQNLRGTTYLFDGDTERTLNRYERVWCVAFQSDKRDNLSYICSSLENSFEFTGVAAPTMFKKDRSVTSEPLSGSGCIMSKGRWEGKTVYDSYRALDSLGLVPIKQWWQFW
ncbi:MAG: hypothetical protein ABSE05_09095 [Syntrophales bacterium]|jgi:hypothetical protein